MGQNFVPRATFLVQAEPGPTAFGVNILYLQAQSGGDAGEAVDHDGDQGPVAQADQAAGVDAVEELAGFVGGDI
jgi:hypothetical protein